MNCDGERGPAPREGVRKLREFSLLEDTEGKLAAVDLADGKRRLMDAWDALFEHGASKRTVS